MSALQNSEIKNIAIIGRAKSGKTSLIKALGKDTLSIIEHVEGSNPDITKYRCDLKPFGEVVLMDTHGIDFSGERKMGHTIKAISASDLVVVVLDARYQLTSDEIELFLYLDKINVPYLLAVNKIEHGVSLSLLDDIRQVNAVHFELSCKENVGIEPLILKIIRSLPYDEAHPSIGDLTHSGDFVIFIVPMEVSLIKESYLSNQISVVKEALEKNNIVVVARENELNDVLKNLKNPPTLIVTDAQTVLRIHTEIPETIPLTTFSILLARDKGDLSAFISGLKRVEELEDGDKILISEACLQHSEEDDIGTVRIPKWLKSHTRKELKFELKCGEDLPEDVSKYKLIVHCGGCALTRHKMQIRMKEARLLDVPIVNYGVLISYLHGAIPRALHPFENAMYAWKKLNV